MHADQIIDRFFLVSHEVVFHELLMPTPFLVHFKLDCFLIINFVKKI